jgi:hypothetical protein
LTNIEQQIRVRDKIHEFIKHKGQRLKEKGERIKVGGRNQPPAHRPTTRWEVRDQMSGGRGQGSKVRNYKSEVRKIRR